MFKTHLRRMLLFMSVIGLAGWLYALSLPKIYEAVVEVQAGSPTVPIDPTLPPEIARTQAVGTGMDLDTDVGYLKSQAIFGQGLIQASQDLGRASLATTNTFGDLYSKYEVTVPAALNQYQASSQRVLQIRARAYSPEEAAAIANGVAKVFVERRLDRSKTSVEDTKRSLRRQLQIARAESTRLANAYQKAKQGSAVADVQSENQALTASREALSNKRDEARASLAATEASIAEYRNILRNTDKTVPAASTTLADPALDIQKSQVARDRADYESLRAIFEDDAVQVVQARKVLERSQKRLSQLEANQKSVRGTQSVQQNPIYVQAQSELQKNIATEASLSASIAKYDDQLARKTEEVRHAPVLEVDIQKLVRDRDTADQLVAKLQTSLSDYQAEADTRVTQILGPATKDSAVLAGPEVRRWAIVSLFAGALLGLAYSFAVESLRLPVHTSWQLAELTALPVAAAVPAIPRPLARRHEAAIREGAFKPIESFRYMAFSMLARESRPRTVLFTGVGGDVGAAAAAAEFAVAVARTGSKTILVDADLRQPTLSGLFGMAGRTGTSDILGRTVLPGDSTDLLAATEHENLSVLPAGSSTEEGLADFQSPYLKGLLDDLAARADLVVILSPAVDVYSDSARLAHYVDEVCMVVSAKTTSYRSIPMAQEILEKSGAKSVSIVLTNASSNDEAFGARVSDSLVRV